MTDDTTRKGDWTGDEWAGDRAEGPRDAPAPDTAETATGTDRWNKTQWVGDQGDGAPAPVDPDEMPEGENDLTGGRHNPGEEHWADGQSTGAAEVTGDRLLEREIDR